MAINLNTGPAYGYQLLALFGVDSLLVAKAAQAKVVVEQTQPGSFTVGIGGTTVAVVTVKSGAITLAKTGSLGPASAAAVKYQFEAALKKAVSLAPEHEASLSSDKEALDSAVKAIAAQPISELQIGATDLSPKLDNVGDEVLEIPTGVVKLGQASKLLQKVSGTSAGSLYTVIALYDGLAVAIRKKPATLSVRVEGDKLLQYQSFLTDVGLDNNGSYASAHFSVSDTPARKKVIGAILGTLGLGGKAKIASLETLL